MIPVCIVQNIAHPQRKATPGENASRRNTYTPPALGKADASSAAISAPSSVRTPETIHTAYTALNDGTVPVITDGCTKIEAPMMMPTTSAVASTRPSARVSMGSRRYRGFTVSAQFRLLSEGALGQHLCVWL